eukprot:1075830-Alexandrium_andersonii.AAC.1
MRGLVLRRRPRQSPAWAWGRRAGAPARGACLLAVRGLAAPCPAGAGRALPARESGARCLSG